MSGLFFAVWITIAVYGVLKLYDQRHRADKAWKWAADDLGLELKPGGWMQQRGLRGRIDGLSVEVEERSANRSKHTAFTVRLPAPVPEDLGFSAENLFTQVSARLGREDLQTGDELFDAAVHIRGDDAEVLARLTQPVRRTLRTVVERGGKVESGKLVLELNTMATEAYEITEMVRTLAGAAGSLHLDGVSVPEALARNAAVDPEALVRLRNLSVLFRDYPRTEVARQAAAKGLEDSDPALRLRAAEFLPGTDGSPALAALLRTHQEPWVRAEALRVLSRKCAYAEISDMVALALRSPDEELRREAVRAVARGGDLTKVDVLVQMMDGPPPLPLVETLAEAFGQLGGPRAEEALLRLLEHESDRVRVVAARALGESGTVRAVEPLLPLTRGLLGGELQQVARDAVRQIQGRLGDAAAGGLSVVEDQGGALSLPAPDGAVAVVDDAAATDPGTRHRSS